MPTEPPPSRFKLPSPELAGDDDLVATGGDLEPGTLLDAYRSGMFPMHLPDGRLGWWSPARRGIIPLESLRVSRSLRKSSRHYSYTVDANPAAVLAGCADPTRPNGWINDDIASAYLRLHELGWVHSVEVWAGDGQLVGGLYGVGVGGLFAGESMFTLAADASKCALVHLVSVLQQGGAKLLDIQWATPHLESLGAIEIDRFEYLMKLRSALPLSGPWG